MSDSIPELAVAYNQAWANHDPDAIVALHTEDAVFHLHDVIEPWVGREAIRGATAGLFADQPDLGFEPVRVYMGDGHFLSEYVMTGTRDGKSFACDGNRRIHRQRWSRGAQGLLHRLGHLPAANGCRPGHCVRAQRSRPLLPSHFATTLT